MEEMVEAVMPLQLDGNGCVLEAMCPFEASGNATLHCYVINQRPGPGFDGRVPIAVVELEEGPRMMTNIVNCDPESVKIGMKVKVCFDDVTDEVTLPMFEPA